MVSAVTADDLFAATVLRPGRYRVANTVTGAEAKLDVAYPELGRRPMLPGEPVRVTVGDGPRHRWVRKPAGR